MPSPDENDLDNRLERRLPHLLIGQPYGYRQELADFLDEEAELDQDIDRVWNRAVSARAGGGELSRLPGWWGAAAASLVATLGLAGILALGQLFGSTDKTSVFNTLRGTQPAAPGTAVAAEVQKRWQPNASSASRAAIVRVRVATTATPVEVRLTQSSGDPELDRTALTAARSDAYRDVPAGEELTLDFDPASGSVRVTGTW